jgi:alanine racemase
MSAAMQRAGALLTVDLDAIVFNWRMLSKLAGNAECAAVVKADAYGLGAAEVGFALQEAGCRTFFVAHLEEGPNCGKRSGSARAFSS